MKSIRLFIRLSRPIYILIEILLYLLGVGIVHYLSGQISWPSFFLGIAWTILLLLGFQYINEYFVLDPNSNDQTWWHTPFSGSSGSIGVDKLPRLVALWAGLTCLTIAASLTVLLVRLHLLNSIATIMLTVLFLGEIIFSIPATRIAVFGYGELAVSIFRVGLIPALAYALQGNELHRMLIMVVFPLVILHLGMLLALEIPTYASDIKYDRKSIIVRIGWQKGMILHNILILCGFVLFGMAFVLGLPLTVGWTIIFVLPIAIFQIWMMNRIADGAKPNWNLLALTALATFSVTAYLLTFALWTH